MSETYVQGAATPGAARGKFNSTAFLIAQMINRIHTCTLVQVTAVTTSGADVAVGFVDILPLVNQTDGFGQPIPHVVIHNCPYFRLQGGANAVILDPVVGDIGLALFAEKDISKVVATGQQANPDSGRRFDMADALYLGGYLNGIPTQFVEFSATGITITSPNAIKLNANDINLTAPTIELNATSQITATTPLFKVNGAVTATGTITAPNVVGTTNVTFGGKSGIAHEHSGVTTGSSNTGAPV